MSSEKKKKKYERVKEKKKFAKRETDREGKKRKNITFNMTARSSPAVLLHGDFLFTFSSNGVLLIRVALKFGFVTRPK